MDFDFKPEDLEPDELDRLLVSLEEANNNVNSIYIPHEKQKAFHCSTNKRRGVFGGNRSGKTECGINEAKFHATGEYPSWYPVAQRWYQPTKGRIVVSDFRKAGGEVLEEKIKKWFSEDHIIKTDRSMGNLSKVYVRHVSGGTSTFDIVTHDQDTMLLEGWAGHWVWCDEPPPRDKYIACLRGLVDYDGRLWITATPLTEPWLHDEFVLNTEVDAWHISISMYDNPHLTKEKIDKFIVSLTPEEKEARLHGKFMHLTGRVYGELDVDVHLVDAMPKGHESWPVWFVLDPADRRPHHGIWAKVDPFNNIYVFDELVYAGTIFNTSKEILRREITNKIRQDYVLRILDPNKGKSPSPTTGLELVDEFASHAVYFTTNVSDDLATGHLSVKERLFYNKDQPVSTTNHPKIYFVKGTTRECVRQLLSYVWDDWKGAMAGGKSLKEKPKDINKDMPDCVRYLCVSYPRFYIPEGASLIPSFDISAVTGYLA